MHQVVIKLMKIQTHLRLRRNVLNPKVIMGKRCGSWSSLMKDNSSRIRRNNNSKSNDRKFRSSSNDAVFA